MRRTLLLIAVSMLLVVCADATTPVRRAPTKQVDAPEGAFKSASNTNWTFSEDPACSAACNSTLLACLQGCGSAGCEIRCQSAAKSCQEYCDAPAGCKGDCMRVAINCSEACTSVGCKIRCQSAEKSCEAACPSDRWQQARVTEHDKRQEEHEQLKTEHTPFATSVSASPTSGKPVTRAGAFARSDSCDTACVKTNLRCGWTCDSVVDPVARGQCVMKCSADLTACLNACKAAPVESPTRKEADGIGARLADFIKLIAEVQW